MAITDVDIAAVWIRSPGSSERFVSRLLLTCRLVDLAQIVPAWPEA
jgi:hypothetical protein